MGLFDGCILASDIDGTLMIEGKINPRNIDKIEYFLKEGGCFSLSTGRSIGAISSVLNQLKEVSPCIVANGCMIYDIKNNRSIYEAYINEEDYRLADLIINCELNVGCEIHCGSDVYTLKRTSEVDDHQNYEWLSSKDIEFEEACKYKWNKAIYFCDSLEDREKLKKKIQKEKHNSNFVDTVVEFDGKVRAYYEQLPFGVSKASALLELSKILNVKKGKIFAIGDYYNDLEMLKTADISAVPCDSPEDVKQYADYITVPCLGGAVADFIDYLAMVCAEKA